MLNSLLRKSIQRTLLTLRSKRLTSISYSAFEGCSKLTSVSLPNVTSISANSFSDCSSLTSMHFSKTNETTIKALSGYSSHFGATRAFIYFDL